MKKSLLFLLLAALLARLGLAYFQYSGDVNNHLIWGHSFLESGPFGFYGRHFPGFNDANYPPLAIYLFGLSVFLYQITLSFFQYLNNLIGAFPSALIPLWQSGNMQAAFLKLPAILADIGIGYLIYRLTKKKLLAAIYLFNPAVFYISAVWGQIESLPIFFLILSFFLIPRRYYLSHLAFVLAVLSKQTALWLLPIFLIAWLKQSDLKTLLQGLALQAVIFFLLYLPFALPQAAIASYLATLSGSSTLVSDQAFNLWHWLFAGARIEDNLPFLGLTVRLWSLLLLALALLFICYRLWRRYSLKVAADSLFWLSLFAFFFQTRVHDRHLAPALPFLLLTSYSPKPKLFFYVALSVYHMINLYLSLGLPFL